MVNSLVTLYNLQILGFNQLLYLQRLIIDWLK